MNSGSTHSNGQPQGDAESMHGTPVSPGNMEEGEVEELEKLFEPQIRYPDGSSIGTFRAASLM